MAAYSNEYDIPTYMNEPIHANILQKIQEALNA